MATPILGYGRTQSYELPQLKAFEMDAPAPASAPTPRDHGDARPTRDLPFIANMDALASVIGAVGMSWEPGRLRHTAKRTTKLYRRMPWALAVLVYVVIICLWSQPIMLIPRPVSIPAHAAQREGWHDRHPVGIVSQYLLSFVSNIGVNALMTLVAVIYFASWRPLAVFIHLGVTASVIYQIVFDTAPRSASAWPQPQWEALAGPFFAMAQVFILIAIVWDSRIMSTGILPVALKRSTYVPVPITASSAIPVESFGYSTCNSRVRTAVGCSRHYRADIVPTRRLCSRIGAVSRNSCHACMPCGRVRVTPAAQRDVLCAAMYSNGAELENATLRLLAAGAGVQPWPAVCAAVASGQLDTEQVMQRLVGRRLRFVVVILTIIFVSYMINYTLSQIFIRGASSAMQSAIMVCFTLSSAGFKRVLGAAGAYGRTGAVPCRRREPLWDPLFNAAGIRMVQAFIEIQQEVFSFYVLPSATDLAAFVALMLLEVVKLGLARATFVFAPLPPRYQSGVRLWQQVLHKAGPEVPDMNRPALVIDVPQQSFAEQPCGSAGACPDGVDDNPLSAQDFPMPLDDTPMNQGSNSFTPMRSGSPSSRPLRTRSIKLAKATAEESWAAWVHRLAGLHSTQHLDLLSDRLRMLHAVWARIEDDDMSRHATVPQLVQEVAEEVARPAPAGLLSAVAAAELQARQQTFLTSWIVELCAPVIFMICYAMRVYSPYQWEYFSSVLGPTAAAHVRANAPQSLGLAAATLASLYIAGVLVCKWMGARTGIPMQVSLNALLHDSRWTTLLAVVIVGVTVMVVLPADTAHSN